jgi:hypothetical protein
MDGIAEPDPDCGDVDAAARDEVAFVVPGGDGSVLGQPAAGALDGVVQSRVEAEWPSSVAVASSAVGLLVSGLGMTARTLRRRRWTRIGLLE